MHINFEGFWVSSGHLGCCQNIINGDRHCTRRPSTGFAKYILSLDAVSQTVLPPNLAGYLGVYHLEIFLLFFVLVVIGPLAGKPRGF